eukprot:COSAG01_NODE_2029_length_8590_cov_5.719501_11_plen_94_part_00
MPASVVTAPTCAQPNSSSRAWLSVSWAGRFGCLSVGRGGYLRPDERDDGEALERPRPDVVHVGQVAVELHHVRRDQVDGLARREGAVGLVAVA